MFRENSIFYNFDQRLLAAENAYSDLDDRIATWETWRDTPATSPARVSESTSGMSLTVLGLSVASAGLLSYVEDIAVSLNDVIDALEEKGIVGNA